MSMERHEPRDASDASGPTAAGHAAKRPARIVLGLAIGCVLLIYAWIASSDLWQADATHPENHYYNLLVEGFRAGQLSLKTTVPAGLVQLADPYDPIANEPYRLHDASYYRGKFYLYFGVTPALVLFWPYAALTGHHLSHQQATMIFCAIGFLASAALLLAIARRHFPTASTATRVTGVLAVGLVNLVPVLLGRADVWEVPIACGYAFAMLALLSLWHAFHAAESKGRWLAAASLAYGLAVGARPSLLPGAAILLLPIIHAWRDGDRTRWRTRLRLMLAATAPITAVGIALLIYNDLRFDSPWEFGQHYQMEGVRLATMKLFSFDYFWTNVRVYFFQPLRWTGDFPFAQGVKAPPIPPGHLGVDGAFGAIVNLPFLWLAGATLLLRPAGGARDSLRPLRWFLVATALLFAINAVTLCTFAGACDRYQVEFLPALTVLAAIGLLALESAPLTVARRNLARGAGVALLLISATTNWLASYKSSPQAQTVAGSNFARAGQWTAAVREYERALRTEPDFAYAHQDLAVALVALGRLPEAIGHFQLALRSRPDFAEARNGLGVVLLRQGDAAAALREFTAALRSAPRFAEAHFDCAIALLQLNRPAEAIPYLEETLRLQPDFPGARERLASVRGKIAPR